MPVVSPVAMEAVCSGTVDHKYVYPDVPPETETSIEPVLSPKHDTSVTVPLTPASSCGLTTKFTAGSGMGVVQPKTVIESSLKL